MAKRATVHFLLVYSLDQGRLIRQDEFTDRAEATRAYDRAERDCQALDRFEIVLVGADSIETVRKTHGHYFRDQTASSIFSDFLIEASASVG